MLSSAALRALKTQLTTANRLGDASTCIDILMQLENSVDATSELLRETMIGSTVNKVARQACASDVAGLARALVQRWKAAVGIECQQVPGEYSNDAGPSSRPSIASPPAANGPNSNSPLASRTVTFVTHTPSASRKPLVDITARPVGSTSVKKRLASGSPEETRAAKKIRKDIAPQQQSDPSDREDHANQPACARPKRPSRTHKDDQVDLSTVLRDGEQLKPKVVSARTASVKALYDALACDSTAATMSILARVVEIEEAIWTAFKPPSDEQEEQVPLAYKNKLRGLLTLKSERYRDYRQRILGGELTPATLIAMKPSDFITDEQRALDEQVRRASLHSAQISASDIAADLREKALWRPEGRR